MFSLSLTAAKGCNGWCTKGNGPPLPPLLCFSLGLLEGSPSPNSILHAFLGLTGFCLHSAFFLCASCVSSLTSMLPPLNLSPHFLSLLPVFFNSQHFLPLSLPCFCLSHSQSFSAASDLQPLDVPPLCFPSLGRLPPSEGATHWGCEGSCLGEGYHFYPLFIRPLAALLFSVFSS